jgi:signal peptidase I
MWIPRRGDSIALTEETSRLYAPLVAQHEGRRLTRTDNTAYVDGVPQHYYVFAKDYYFMMGDHRMESQDSRILGPVPDDHIIGKATHITWSLTPTADPNHPSKGNPEPTPSHRFRWNRVFKLLK